MGDTKNERNDFITALNTYNIDILKLQNINIDEPENTLSTQINDFYNQYMEGNTDNNKTLPDSKDYIKNPDKLDKDDRNIIIEKIKKNKPTIENYIDEYIKPTNNQNTKTLKFADLSVNNNTDEKLYYIYQNLLKQESDTKIIGLNAVNWGYFGIVTNGLSALFQMYTLYKTKSAKSFSMPFIWIMTFLNAVYCLVGILENNVGLAVATFFFVVYNFTVIYVYYKYN
jgi:uncharacterized protein with PQ loop repeat